MWFLKLYYNPDYQNYVNNFSDSLYSDPHLQPMILVILISLVILTIFASINLISKVFLLNLLNSTNLLNCLIQKTVNWCYVTTGIWQFFFPLNFLQLVSICGERWMLSPAPFCVYSNSTCSMLHVNSTPTVSPYCHSLLFRFLWVFTTTMMGPRN